MTSKRYYWLKVENSFMDRHDVKLIRNFKGNMLHCNANVTAYVTLLLESVTHEGYLRFSEDNHYEMDDLAALCYLTEEEFTPLFEFLIKKGIIEVEIDKTLYFPYVSKHLGTEVDSAERVRKHREKKKKDAKVLHCNTEVTNSNTELELELEKEKEKKDLIVITNNFTKDSFEFKVASGLYLSIKARNENFKKPKLDDWASVIDKMKRLDKISESDIINTLGFAIKDSFWQNNILSTVKFRKQYDQLYLKAKDVVKSKGVSNEWDID